MVGRDVLRCIGPRENSRRSSRLINHFNQPGEVWVGEVGRMGGTPLRHLHKCPKAVGVNSIEAVGAN